MFPSSDTTGILIVPCIQVVRDRSSVSLIGPSATPQQMSNAQIASFLWHCRNRVGRLKDDYTEATFAILAPELEVRFLPPYLAHLLTRLQGLEREYAQLTEPLVAAVRRDVGALIARLHKADFGDGAGAPGGGASAYMRELVDKLAFIKTEVFANYNIGEARRNWCAACSTPAPRPLTRAEGRWTLRGRCSAHLSCTRRSLVRSARPGSCS
jgi:hypothetical protein